MAVVWPKEPDYPDLPYEVWVVRRDDMGKVVGAELVQRFTILAEARRCRDTSDRNIVDRDHFQAELESAMPDNGAGVRKLGGL
jgi:hypothetical protein